MENDFLKHNNQDETDDQLSPDSGISRGRSSFFKRGQPDGLFKRMFEADDDDEEDDDSPEKPKKKLSKFRKSFRNLFRGSIVPPPDRIGSDLSEDSTRSEDESVVPRNDFGDWLKKMSQVGIVSAGEQHTTDETESSISNILDYQADDPITHEDTLRISSDDPLEGISEDKIDLVSEQIQDEIDRVPEVEEANAFNNPNTPDQEAIVPVSEPESVQQILARQAAVNYGIGQSGGAIEDGEPVFQNIQNITNETYVNNGWGPALVVDQLSRHRDRNIKKSDKRQDKEIDDLKAAQRKTAESEKASRGQNNDTITPYYHDSHRQEIQQIQKNTEPVPVFKHSESTPANHDKFVPKYEQKQTFINPEQGESSFSIEKNTTDNISKNIVNFAERPSSLIEREYEKRHEIKDKHSYSQIAEGALKARPNSRYSATEIGGGQTEVNSTSYHSQKIEQKNEADRTMYKQAARNGFVLAVAVLIAFLVIYTISR